jgi:serine protease Do
MRCGSDGFMRTARNGFYDGALVHRHFTKAGQARPRHRLAAAELAAAKRGERPDLLVEGLMTRSIFSTNVSRTLAISAVCALALGAAAWTVATRAASLPSWLTSSSHASLHKTAARNLADFADIVDAVKPTVFAVQSRIANDAAAEAEEEKDDADSDVPSPSNPSPTRRLLTSQGSGFFISSDGYAVTNGHVVENAESTEILTDDQRTYAAKVVGTDPVSDLALLKVDGRNDFPFVTLADETPRIGSWVLAFGNPFGLGGTVTAGIVSARERNLSIGGYQDLIQIDAPINKGDSGGPSFDLNGKVIGVNTMIISPSGGSIGIAFAIPAETVKTVVPQLKEKGVVTHGWMGIQTQPLTPDLAISLEMKEVRGALVVKLEPAGPAAKAGLTSGDVVTSVNGEPIKQASDLARKVSNSAPGTSLTLGVVRGGEQKNVTVTLAQVPAPRTSPASAPSAQ